jgi:hypothetical protein
MEWVSFDSLFRDHFICRHGDLRRDGDPELVGPFEVKHQGILFGILDGIGDVQVFIDPGGPVPLTAPKPCSSESYLTDLLFHGLFGKRFDDVVVTSCHNAEEDRFLIRMGGYHQDLDFSIFFLLTSSSSSSSSSSTTTRIFIVPLFILFLANRTFPGKVSCALPKLS